MARNAHITTPSTVPIVTLAEAKIHLRVSHNDDDAYITSLVSVAKDTIDNYCNTLVMYTKCKQRADCWNDMSELYFSPVKNSGELNVIDIKYYDKDDVLQTWAASNYLVDIFSSPARIGLSIGSSIPETSNRLNAIECEYDVGTKTQSDVPLALQQCALILIGQFYENRQVAVVGRSVGTIPMSAQYLMNPYKIQTLGLPSC
tara:strand:- start:87 stop:692 length:606 start_codon:yes stop_codon:yes gene_type:complete